MSKNPFAPDVCDLPEILPIFPLEGALLLPLGQLPLNIFEPRYLAMVDHALSKSRMIGMVQPRDIGSEDQDAVCALGCAGKITEFSQTPDGRYMITLTGICRFGVQEEQPLHQGGFRQVSPCWKKFESDVVEPHCLDVNRVRLKSLLEVYFDKEGMSCDWEAIDDAPDGRLITCLSMICPFDCKDKQALLEAACCKSRAELFMAMLEMAVSDKTACGNIPAAANIKALFVADLLTKRAGADMSFS